ncbi:hypothetical protein KVR01_010796 [Diaporthe batatas]|uniref:uncharacterized protein n=1 Tax=Diaporthe batatas TaxID=748121 RepID=UPI001D03A41C|nr:uncharacterized protein KVR01_010796 [Diaporthe batatas]KAG8159135.1 hypothetical protein KVR01_010796 [Diaporthe batatas]
MADTTSPALRSTASLVGITSTLLVSGFNISTSYLFVPHLYSLDKHAATRIFDRLYHDGLRAVVPLAAAGILSFSYLAYSSSPPSPAGALGTTGLGLARRPAFAAAAGLVVATLAWTRLVIMPVNQRLIGIAREVGAKDKVSAADVEALLRRWWWMNYVRGAGALVAGSVYYSSSGTVRDVARHEPPHSSPLRRIFI